MQDEPDADKLHDFPEPSRVILHDSDLAELRAKNPGKQQDSVTLLHRLTIVAKDNNFLPILNTSESAKKYHLVAVIPESANTLLNLMKSSFRGDIVAFDPQDHAKVKWTRTLYNDCVNRGFFFELPYGPMIRDSTLRRRVLAMGHNYGLFGKSKNTFLASGAETTLELRGPHDVANLGFLLGMNEQQGKDAVLKNGVKVAQAGLGRMVGPYRAVITKVDDLGHGEKWKVPDSSDDESDTEVPKKKLKQSEDDDESSGSEESEES